jgi:WhiB family redox-sensing transcriptional regulator
MTYLPDQRWRLKAACRNEDSSAFFPPATRGQGGTADYSEAAAICARCPVRVPCGDYAVGAPEKYGYWAGMDPDRRASERRKRLRSAASISRGRAA